MDKQIKIHDELHNSINIKNDPFFILRNKSIINCNNLALDIFEYTSKDEVIGLNFCKLLFNELDKNIFDKNIKDNTTKRFRCSYLSKDNKKFLANTKISKEGESVYIYINPIYQHDEMKGIIVENKDRYRYLFDNHRAVMLLIDPETGRIIECNKRAISYYGYKKEILLSMKIQDINTLDNKQVYKEMETANKEERNFFYFSHRLANGEIRDVEVYSVPIKVGEKKLLYSIVYDVSKIRLQKTLFNQLLENSPLAIAIIDNNHKVIDINENFTKLFQYDFSEVKNKRIEEIIYQEDIYDGDSDDIINQGLAVRKAVKRKRKDNKIIDVDVLAYPIIIHGNKIGISVVYTDVTKKIKYENKLKLFEKALDNNTEGIIISDKYGKIEWINNAFTQITGYTLSDVIGQSLTILKSDRYGNEFYKEIFKCISTEGKWTGEILNKNKSGKIYNQSATIYSIKDENNRTTHFTGIIRDITEKKKKEEQIKYMSFRDIITGLYNRTFFIDKLEREISKNNNKNLAVLFLDLDDFKTINDTLGHSVGDKVLKEFSIRIQKCVRDIDTVARIGGDEFIILMPQLENKMICIDIANSIVNSLREPIIINQKKLEVSVSIGISEYPNDGKDSETLMKNADIAMYKSKENKNVYEKRISLFHSNMNNKIREDFELSNHLRYAIEKNELLLYYQPIIDINTQKIIGAEALLRWKHPKFGFISPEKFIPIAEKNGMIDKIGTWVLKNAYKQNKGWHDKGYSNLKISVNISVNQLKQKKFPELVSDIINEVDLDPRYLELEITESISAENIYNIEKILHSLEELGISLSIDDFGTGYSSLGQLRKLPISKLKIDKSFINDIDNKYRNTEIALAIITMAKSLNIKVVAEGIETKEQLQFLKENRCEFGQGYLFSRPVDSSSFEKILSMQDSKRASEALI